MTYAKPEGPATWLAANPEGYAVGDLAAFMGSELAERRTQALLKQEQEIVIAREDDARIVWNGRGIRIVNNGVAKGISYYAVLEAFCGANSAVPEALRTVDALVPFLQKAEPTKCPVKPEE